MALDARERSYAFLGPLVMARGGVGRYQRLGLRAKSEYARARLGAGALLFVCRLCAVKTTAIDRQGHIDRCHRGGDVLVVFRAVRK